MFFCKKINEEHLFPCISIQNAVIFPQGGEPASAYPKGQFSRIAMKKTMIALLALGGLAFADPITLPVNTDYTHIQGAGIAGIGNGQITEEGLVSFLTKVNTAGVDELGWFGGTGQSQNPGTEISITSSTEFVFTSRPRYSGQYVAMGVELPGAAESITLSFNSTGNIRYAVFSYDTETSTAVRLLNTDAYVTGTQSVSYNTAEVTGDRLFVIWGTGTDGDAGCVSGGTAITVSDIALSYTPVPTPAVPEPATATLSLLALAGLAARRRRK